jgi:5'-methylthioadenosine phosphorylase
MNDLKIGLIGGTGLGQALAAATEGTRHEIDTPFGRPSDAIIETTWAGVPVLILSRHGPGHVINPTQIPTRANIYALKQLGCTHILASGAVGSLREEFKPRDLVVPDQVIDKTFKRANTFFERAAVHVEFAEPFCPVLRQLLLDAGKGSGFSGQGSENANPAASDAPEPQTLNPEPFSIHDRGCYVCMEGPAFSTRAESLMHRLWGGDLIGMTAMPEAKLAREAEMSYALVALVTDYDCWRNKPSTTPAGTEAPSASAEAALPNPHELLREIIANVQAATQNAVTLTKRAVELAAQRRDVLMAAPAQRALELAIWSDKSRIDPDEVQRLKPLWVKYFENAPQ